MASGADAVIIDLEDSITPERKQQARAAALEFLKAQQAKKQRPRLLVRINGLDTGMTDADLDAVVPGKPDAIVFPKAEGGAERHASRRQADRARGHRRLARGLASRFWRRRWSRPPACFSPAPFATASTRLIGLTWGPEDLSAELGAEANRDADGHAHRALSAGALDVPLRRGGGQSCRRSRRSMSISATPTACAATREDARRDGFSGRLAIHPAQVPVINEVFTPSAEQIAKAKAVVAAFAAQPGAGAVGIDGKMYRPPASGAGAGACWRASAEVYSAASTRHRGIDVIVRVAVLRVLHALWPAR